MSWIRRPRFLRRPRAGSHVASTPDFTVSSGLDHDERVLVEQCAPFTLAGVERIVATADAVAHVVDHDVPGALVECGVWRGGSVLAMVLTLERLGVDDRDLFLFDTFTGMTAPTDHDRSRYEPPATHTFEQATADGRRPWGGYFDTDRFGIEQVRDVVLSTGYPADRVHLVVGPVEETLAGEAPETAAVVRLDTDWYESTRCELEVLWPRLSAGGVLLVDDYGHWEGARRAVDEYFDGRDDRPLFARTDYTGRMGVKR